MGFFFGTTKTDDRVKQEAKARFNQVQIEMHKENILNMTKQLDERGLLNAAMSLHDSLKNYIMLASMDDIRKGQRLSSNYAIKLIDGYLKIIKVGE